MYFISAILFSIANGMLHGVMGGLFLMGTFAMVGALIWAICHDF